MAITRKHENPGGNGVLLPNGQRLFVRKPDGEVNPATPAEAGSDDPKATPELKLSTVRPESAPPTLRANFAQFGPRLRQPKQSETDPADPTDDLDSAA